MEESHKNLTTIADFEVLTKLGEGGFGLVFSVRHRRSGRSFALKVQRKPTHHEMVSHLRLERDIMTVVGRHPFLVSLQACMQTRVHILFFMELLDGEPVDHRLDNLQVGRRVDKLPLGLPEHEVIIYAAEIILALKFLHYRGIIHNDVKAENLIICRDGHLRLIDYGISTRPPNFPSWRTFKDREDPLELSLCTKEYKAPESIEPTHKSSYSVDFWSLGVTVYRMLTGSHPFSAADTDVLFHKITSTPHPPLSKHPERKFSRDVCTLVDGLLQKSVSKRLGCGKTGFLELERHPAFKLIDWTRLKRKNVTMSYLPKPRSITSPSVSSCKSYHPPQNRMMSSSVHLKQSEKLAKEVFCAHAAYFPRPLHLLLAEAESQYEESADNLEDANFQRQFVGWEWTTSTFVDAPVAPFDPANPDPLNLFPVKILSVYEKLTTSCTALYKFLLDRIV